MENTPFKMKGFSGFGGSPLKKPTGLKGKLQAAREALSSMTSSSTISQMVGSYSKNKKRIRQENARDNTAS